MRSLYVHFPFCESKCHYCDFYSLGRERTRADDADAFESALTREIRLMGPRLAPRLETIFFGGGTPSMTPPDSMKRALEPLWNFTSVDSGTEWTMEANPSSIERNRMKQYRAMGINRVSMGVQALREDLLKDLGRVHSRADALRALGDVADAGFDNISVDLLCGVPHQGLKDLEEALQTLTSYPITHLSCYLLTLPPHHRMFPQLPDEDTQLSHLLLIDSWMKAQGFEHYEISNFAKPGKRARHNLNYWKGESYLGLGPSAHSYDAGSRTRWKNISSLHKYCGSLEKGLAVTEATETLNDEQLNLERWMLALRLSDGFPAEWMNTPARTSKAKALREAGFLETHPEDSARLRLTARGFTVSDQIVASLS